VNIIESADPQVIDLSPTVLVAHTLEIGSFNDAIDEGVWIGVRVRTADGLVVRDMGTGTRIDQDGIFRYQLDLVPGEYTVDLCHEPGKWTRHAFTVGESPGRSRFTIR